ncbi:Hypothetical protein SFBmNL_00048 [Candidatus Arthromitus sp. SFB-mouse-NL]|uniref:DUF1576 domain-containing protein n=1 Tax=Candidatus Arthromitus sp. SFB-mouse-NL TaxID=1508644 RepID=UPI00049A4136|nr:DUF1576 domain-containing protein [Candidatus Arthromitus sp. SFB-mouse-NL]AID43982.1 Hypothetical protein SFBmNL_00048 [Candidatus Arthromitus sp. SFB-mouse-NL]
MNYKLKFNKKCLDVYIIHLIIFLFIGLVGIFSTPYKDLFIGIKKIITTRSILLTDYMYVSGIGATLLNASITSLLILMIYKINKTKPNGSMIMSLWLTLGFSMVGKNFINIWPTIIGVYLYSKIQKDSFSNYVLIATLSTSLSPISSELFEILNLNSYITLLLSISISILIGMILPPLAKFTLKMHQGYNLYNVGFANGLITVLIISILNYFGIEIKQNLLWSTEYKTISLFLVISLIIFLTSLGIKKFHLSKLSNILRHSGRTITDFYLMYGNSSYLNMGILGIIFLSYIVIVNGDLNGPTIALLFCIIGFGAIGKHPLNTIPLVLGVSFTAYISNIQLNTPTTILTSLGSTALAPISGQFGIIIGFITGCLHLILMKYIGHLSGGINLYNNGFIAGILAIILIPIIDGFKKGDI